MPRIYSKAGKISHVVRESLDVSLLLGKLLLKLHELLLLAHADGQILVGALPPLESVSVVV
jgi:hypothetical protein